MARTHTHTDAHMLTHTHTLKLTLSHTHTHTDTHTCISLGPTYLCMQINYMGSISNHVTSLITKKEWKFTPSWDVEIPIFPN